MGATLESLIGDMPLVTSREWEPWLHRGVALRLSRCPSERATTIYVDPTDGDDGNDGLSTAAPKQTYTPTGANIRVRVKGGTHEIDPDDYTGAVFTTGGFDNITIDTYTTAANQGKATLNFFSLKYSSGWTQAGSTDRWTRTESDAVAWLRRQDQRLDVVFTKATSTALVESTPLSFYYTGTTLHVNVGEGLDPNDFDLEAVKDNDVYGFRIANGSDFSRLQDVRADGAGLNTGSLASNVVGIADQLSGTDECVVIGCESYFCGTHAIVHVQGSDSGGCSLFMYCKAGYCHYNGSGGETIYNTYSSDGENETIWFCCEATYGTLPHTSWYPSNVRRGGAFYGHTLGGAETSLIVNYRPLIKTTNDFGCSASTAFADVPAATELADVRGVVYGEVLEKAQHVVGGQLIINNGARVFSHWNCQPPHNATGGMSTNPTTTGWLIGCDVDIDYRNQTGPTIVSLYNGTAASSPKIWHCRFHHHHLDPTVQVSAFDFDVHFNSGAASTSNSANAELVNSIVIVEGGNPSEKYLSLVNDPDQVRNNAFFGILQSSGARGYTSTADYVELIGPIPFGRVPFDGLPLHRAGDSDVRVFLPGNIAEPSIGPVGELVSLPYYSVIG